MAQPTFLPYSQHHLADEDLTAVLEAMRSDWLSQGPLVCEFEEMLADFVGAHEAVVVSSDSAALHLVLAGLDIGSPDAIIIPSNAFVNMSQAAIAAGASIRFADIDPETGLIDPDSVRNLLDRDPDRIIKAICTFHFAGQPADQSGLYEIAQEYDLKIIDNAGQALGSSFTDQGIDYRIGGNHCSEATVFSFHPEGHITTGEGGAITTSNRTLADNLRHLRSHNIRRTHLRNSALAFTKDGLPNPGYYEAGPHGYNFRLSELNAALGTSQLKRMPSLLEVRRAIARKYDRLISQAFSENEIRPLATRPGVTHAYGLYVVLINYELFDVSRAVLMNRLRERGIGTQVHYPPLHLQPDLPAAGRCPESPLPYMEKYYSQTLTLPLYPDLTEDDVIRVVDELTSCLMPVRATKSNGYLTGKSKF